MHMMIAEQRALPSTKGMKGERDGNGNIDADHADLGAAREVSRGVAITGEDGGSVAELMRVDEAQGLFVIVAAHDRQHRPENLLLVDTHRGRRMIEEAAANEVAVLVTL